MPWHRNVEHYHNKPLPLQLPSPMLTEQETSPVEEGSSPEESSQDDEDYVEFLHAKIASLDSQLTAALSRAKSTQGELEEAQEDNDTRATELEIEVAHWRQRARDAAEAQKQQEEISHKLRLETVMLRKYAANLREDKLRRSRSVETEQLRHKRINTALLSLSKSIRAFDQQLEPRQYSQLAGNHVEQNRAALRRAGRQRLVQERLQEQLKQCMSLFSSKETTSLKSTSAVVDARRVGLASTQAADLQEDIDLIAESLPLKPRLEKVQGGERVDIVCDEEAKRGTIRDEVVMMKLEKQKFMLDSMKAVLEKQRSELRKAQQAKEEALRELGSVRQEKEQLASMLEEANEQLDFNKRSSEHVTTEVGWLESKLETSAETIESLKEELVLKKDRLEEKSAELDRLSDKENTFTERLAALNEELAKWKSKYSRLNKWRSNVVDQVAGWKQLLYEFTVAKPTEAEQLMQSSLKRIEQDHLSLVENIESKLM